MKMRFFKCKICGKILVLIKDTATPTICCGEEMMELKPASIDAVVEKHVPVISINNSIVEVKVGSMAHPMEEKHYIEWIAIQTNQGYQIKMLKPGDDPKLYFALVNGEKIETAYAYCNLHGLWSSENKSE